MITIVLADDDHLVREGLRVLLDSIDDMTVVGEASTGAEVVEVALNTRPDVVMMDIRMPHMDGIEATRRIVAQPDPRPRILVLTTFDLDENVHDALEAGADGFLLKRTTLEDLIDAIRSVAAGDAMVSPALTRRLLRHVASLRSDETHTAVPPLTSREEEVLACLAAGQSNTEIADHLIIGNETVKTHLKRICAKIGARDRTQAVIWAYKSGFVGHRK